MKKLFANLLLAVVYCYSYAQSVPPPGQETHNPFASFTQWTQTENDVPFRVTTISASQAELANPQTVADLLGSSGDAFIQKNQLGGGSPLIRGFGSNRQLYVVDGVRLSNAISQSMNLQNMISLDPYSVNSAEIRFGPGAVSLGSDAIGGAICFEMFKPEYSETGKPVYKGNAIARFASADMEASGHLDVSAGWQNWAVLTSFSHYDFNDLRMGSHGPEEYLRPYYAERKDGTDVVTENDRPLLQNPSGYSQTNLMQKVMFRPNEYWDLSYGFYLSTTTGIPRYDNLLRTADSLPLMAESSYGPQLWIMNRLNATYKWSSTICDRMDISLAYQYFENSRTDRYFNDTTRHQQEEKINSIAVNFSLEKCIRDGHRLNYGMEVIYDNVRSDGTEQDIITGEAAPGPGCYPQAGWGSYGLFLDYLLELNEEIKIRAGLRYNLYQLDAEFDTSLYNFPFSMAYVNNDAMTGSLGITWEPTGKWAMNTSFSTGFRSPNVDDIGRLAGAENGSVIVPNPSLESEYAYNMETGVSRIFGNFLKVDLTGYFTWLSRALVCRDFVLGSQDSIWYNGDMSKVQAIQNAAHAMVYGLQADMELRLPLGFGFHSKVSWQEGSEELLDGSLSPMREAAPVFGRAGATWSANKLKADLYLNFSGKVSYENLPPEELERSYLYALDSEGDPYSPSWCTLNLKASYQASRYLLITGGFENITDVRYRPYGSGISAPGFNFILGLKASF